MKKQLLFRFCLMAAALALFSCRTDYLPEKESTYNNSSAFQLTSKKISLDEAKHKDKILSVIKDAEVEIEAKVQAKDKVINYSNGVSIDTENVIYIENGPNYHTYTFPITREGASGDAPLENLVLSPLTDGTYRELLFTYTLTPAEKESIANGYPIDTKGKVNVTVLAQGTYNSGGTLAKLSCNWEETTVWVPCSENLHDESNFHECRFLKEPTKGTPPRAYTVKEYKCLMEPDPGTGSGGGGSVSGGSGGGSPTEPPKGGPTYPCDGSGISTGPQKPILSNDNGACSGTPTLPTIPSPNNNPCKRIKNWFANPKFKSKYDSLTRKTPTSVFDLDHELAFYMRYAPKGTSVAPGFVDVDMPPCSTDGNLPTFTEGMGGLGHTHNNNTCNGNIPIRVPSPTDIRTFINILIPEAGQYTGSYLNAYSLVATSDANYMMMYKWN